MKRLNDYRMVLVLVGFVTAIMLGSGHAKADFTFGEPTNLGPSINTSVNDWAPCISADGLSLYFTSARPGGYGGTYMGFDIWVATRETTEDDWSTAVNVGLPVNSAVDETQPCISSDGLSLFFDSYNRTGGMGGTDLWVATRAAVYDPWSEPVNLGPTVNTSSNDNAPSAISSNRVSCLNQ
jgi:OOP family OmpA-OmpF porin